MFRCICRHALFSVHTRVRSTSYTPADRMETYTTSAGVGGCFSVWRGGPLNVLLLNHNARSRAGVGRARLSRSWDAEGWRK